MPKKTIREVIHDTVRDEMRRDPNVILMGEDVAGGAGCSGEDDAFGGAFGFYKGAGRRVWVEVGLLTRLFPKRPTSVLRQVLR